MNELNYMKELKTLLSGFNKTDIFMYWLNDSAPYKEDVDALKKFIKNNGTDKLTKTGIASMIEFIGRIKLINLHGPIITDKRSYSSTHGIEAISLKNRLNLVVFEAKSTDLTRLPKSIKNADDKIKEASSGLRGKSSLTSAGTLGGLKTSINRKSIKGFGLTSAEQASLLFDLENIRKGAPDRALISYSYNGTHMSLGYKNEFHHQDNIGNFLTQTEFVELYEMIEAKI